jgi:hypothetical protein
MKKVKAMIHPQALEALKRVKADEKAGHSDAADYWRGQASGFFLANPKKRLSMEDSDYGLARWYDYAMSQASQKFGKDAVKEVTESGQVVLRGGAMSSPETVESWEKWRKRGYISNPDGIFDASTDIQRTEIRELVNRSINAPYVYTDVSTLGGVSQASIIIKLSLDKKEDWSNGIFQNSRYSMFHLSRDGTLEQFSKSYRVDKFRKCRVKSIQEAISKINGYIKQVTGRVPREDNPSKGENKVKINKKILMKYDPSFGSYFGTTAPEPYPTGKNHFKPSFRSIFISGEMYPGTDRSFFYITSSIHGEMRLYKHRDWFDTEVGNIFVSGKTREEAIKKFEHNLKNLIYNKSR